MKSISISQTAVECYIDRVVEYLTHKYGTDTALREISPLEWYVWTGRASCDFLRALVSSKAYMVGRKLHEGGSYTEIINRIHQYLGTEAV